MRGPTMVLEVFFKALKRHFYVLLGYQPSVKVKFVTPPMLVKPLF